MSSTIAHYRAIQALLQTLQGTTSTGTTTVTSTSGTITLPARTFAIPDVDGEIDESRLVMVSPNPATADGSWEVTTGGYAVAIESVSGGTATELPAGTVLHWDLVLAGLPATSEVDAGGLTGGAALATLGTLKEFRGYKDMGPRPDGADLFRAQIHQYPAAVLSWVGSNQADGTVQPSLGPRGARVGRGLTRWRDTWHLWLVSSRLDGADPRRREGDILRDDVLELLTDRMSHRGLTVSDDPGVQVVSASIAAVNPGHYIDLVRFTTMRTLCKRDLRGPFSYWLTTRMRVQATGDPLIDLPDVTIPMT